MVPAFSFETPILLTGGSGFIGQHIQAYFREQGYTVLAPRHAELELEDATAVKQYIEANNIQCVIHAASRGATPEAHMNAKQVYDHNVAIFEHVAQAIMGRGCLVNLGSGAEYGKHRPLVEVAEDYAGQHPPLDAYGKAKLFISRCVERMPNAVNLRLFGVFGAGEDPTRRFISYAIAQHRQGLPITIRQNVRFSYLWVNDVAPAIHALLKSPPPAHSRILNLVPDDPITLLEVLACIKRVTGKAMNVQLHTPGLQPEYSGHNGLIRQHYPGLVLTPTEQGIEALVQAYVAQGHPAVS